MSFWVHSKGRNGCRFSCREMESLFLIFHWPLAARGFFLKNSFSSLLCILPLALWYQKKKKKKYCWNAMTKVNFNVLFCSSGEEVRGCGRDWLIYYLFWLEVRREVEGRVWNKSWCAFPYISVLWFLGCFSYLALSQAALLGENTLGGGY